MPPIDTALMVLYPHNLIYPSHIIAPIGVSFGAVISPNSRIFADDSSSRLGQYHSDMNVSSLHR